MGVLGGLPTTIEALHDSLPEMPEKGSKLTANEVSKLREWIAAGAPWPVEVTLKEKLDKIFARMAETA